MDSTATCSKHAWSWGYILGQARETTMVQCRRCKVGHVLFGGQKPWKHDCEINGCADVTWDSDVA